MARKSNREADTPWAAALRLLARRDYATQELRRTLLGRGFPAETVEDAITRAAALGYLDDANYAARLSRTLLATGRAAGPKLTLELRRRGLPDDLVRANVTAAREGNGEEAALRALIARRFPAFAFAAADARERRRVVLFLQRRGFPLDHILRELKRTDP